MTNTHGQTLPVHDAGPAEPQASAHRRREKPDPNAPLPRVALRRDEAAESLGMSLSSFERYVQPELRMIRRGGVRVVPVAELERWADGAAESVV